MSIPRWQLREPNDPKVAARGVAPGYLRRTWGAVGRATREARERTGPKRELARLRTQIERLKKSGR
jgi:hypothetical protein